MTTPIPTPERDHVANAALDHEAFCRELFRKYHLTSAEQLDVLTMQMRTIIRAAEDLEHREAHDR